ncbi:uncharacterized protein TNCV_3295451 [Trichonephila clavipes]|uniref:Uncharacterized protein n=1 Tax=Trichonephila clavipes TaxID=2585209 RepID=A0A8X6T143_TRICX|nr:uncharacterized protein TNCV_3295451 [Trichonephila clavipes]
MECEIVKIKFKKKETTKKSRRFMKEKTKVNRKTHQNSQAKNWEKKGIKDDYMKRYRASQSEDRASRLQQMHLHNVESGRSVANNPLYKDVTIDQNVVTNEEDIIRVEEAPAEMAEETNGDPSEDTSSYMRINDFSRIVPFVYKRSNLNMISGDQIYSDVRFQTEKNFATHPIDEDGYLLVRNFNVIKNDLVAFNKRFQINFDGEPRIYRSLNDQVDQADFGRILHQGVDIFFEDHNAGNKGDHLG